VDCSSYSLLQPHMNRSTMLALAMFFSICQDSVADSLVEVLSSRYSLKAAVQRHLDYFEAAELINDDALRRLQTADLQSQAPCVGARDANETSRRLFLPALAAAPWAVAAVETLIPWVAQGVVTGTSSWVARAGLDWWFSESRRLGASEQQWKSAKTGVNAGLKQDSLHKVPREAAALAMWLEHMAGHEEHAKMSHADVAARLGAAIVHDLTRVTTKMTVASVRNPTKDGYEKYSTLKHPTRESKVAMALALSQFLVDSGSANGRRLFGVADVWKEFTNWLSQGMKWRFVGSSTHHVVKNDIMKVKVQDAMALFESNPEATSTEPDIASTCTCGNPSDGGCGCSWTGASKEHCGNDDGTPCFANCCYDGSSSPCGGICDEVEWTSPQSCYEQQCAGCPTSGQQLPEACVDCAENNCHNAGLISQWAVEKALETKPWRHNQFIQITACLCAGVVLMLAFGIIVINRFHTQSGQTHHAIINQENGEGTMHTQTCVL